MIVVCIALGAQRCFVASHGMIMRSNFVNIEVVVLYLLVCFMVVISVLGRAWSIVPWALSPSGPDTVPMLFLRSLAI